MLKFDNNLISIVTKILQNNHVPMLLGEPGIGKSSWVEALGNSMHTKVFVLACNQLASSKLAQIKFAYSNLASIKLATITGTTGSAQRRW